MPQKRGRFVLKGTALEIRGRPGLASGMTNLAERVEMRKI
jgi:hypothetical protein